MSNIITNELIDEMTELFEIKNRFDIARWRINETPNPDIFPRIMVWSPEYKVNKVYNCAYFPPANFWIDCTHDVRITSFENLLWRPESYNWSLPPKELQDKLIQQI